MISSSVAEWIAWASMDKHISLKLGVRLLEWVIETLTGVPKSPAISLLHGARAQVLCTRYHHFQVSATLASNECKMAWKGEVDWLKSQLTYRIQVSQAEMFRWQIFWLHKGLWCPAHAHLGLTLLHHSPSLAHRKLSDVVPARPVQCSILYSMCRW